MMRNPGKNATVRVQDKETMHTKKIQRETSVQHQTHPHPQTRERPDGHSHTHSHIRESVDCLLEYVKIQSHGEREREKREREKACV